MSLLEYDKNPEATRAINDIITAVAECIVAHRDEADSYRNLYTEALQRLYAAEAELSKTKEAQHDAENSLETAG